jgi:hypothetical protein
VYRTFVRLRFPYSSFVSFRLFVRSCIVRSFRVSCVRSFRVSCVFSIVRVKRSFIFRSFRLCFSFVSFVFFVRLRLVRIVSLYDPGSALVQLSVNEQG